MNLQTVHGEYVEAKIIRTLKNVAVVEDEKGNRYIVHQSDLPNSKFPKPTEFDLEASKKRGTTGIYVKRRHF